MVTYTSFQDMDNRKAEKAILDNVKKNIRRNDIQSLKNYALGRSNMVVNTANNARKALIGRSSFKSLKKRETGTKRLLTAIGALPSASKSYGGGGPGRPKGTYKYGIPIDQYKRLQAQRKALYSQYAQDQNNRLAQRGLTPDQVKMLQAARTSQEIPQPNQVQAEAQFDSAQDDLEFQKYLAKNTISPNTQTILDNLKRIQNKAIADDINQQRVHRERKIINDQQSLLKARNLFGPDSNKINIFDDANNILKAENVFSKSSGINILQTGRANIMDTNATGNTLRFF